MATFLYSLAGVHTGIVRIHRQRATTAEHKPQWPPPQRSPGTPVKAESICPPSRSSSRLLWGGIIEDIAVLIDYAITGSHSELFAVSGLDETGRPWHM